MTGAAADVAPETAEAGAEVAGAERRAGAAAVAGASAGTAEVTGAAADVTPEPPRPSRGGRSRGPEPR